MEHFKFSRGTAVLDNCQNHWNLELKVAQFQRDRVTLLQKTRCIGEAALTGCCDKKQFRVEQEVSGGAQSDYQP